MLYLNGGIDGLNCVVPAGSANYNAYRSARPTLYRAPERALGRGRGRLDAGAGHRRRDLVREPGRLRHGEQRRHEGLRHAVGRRPRRCGLRPRLCPGHALPACQRLALRRDATTSSRGSCRSSPPAGSVAGSTSTARRTNPLQAISIGSSLSKQIRTRNRARVLGADDVQRLSLRRRRRRLERQRERGGEPPRGDPGHDVRPDAQPVDLSERPSTSRTSSAAPRRRGRTPTIPPARSPIG